MSQPPPASSGNTLLPSPLHRDPRATSDETRVERLLPFVRTLRTYRLAHLRPDLVAGLTVALFTVPQAMAYALIAGFPPSAGIATAVVASILGAAFGSSEFLINGPTNALSVMLAANAALFAAQGDATTAIILLTLMVGVVQVVAGLARVGSLTRFVSEPVLTGFTAGAGLYIVINQLPSFLGIERSAIARDLWGVVPMKCAFFDFLLLLRSLDTVHVATFGLAALTFGIVRGLQACEPLIGRKLPAPFIAVVVVTLVVAILGWDQADAGAERVRVVRDIEPVARHLPQIRLPRFDASMLQALLGPAAAIGLMGSVEAIAIGKSLAARAHHPFNASRQLIGEGLCNLGAGLVGGFASSGSFSRTAVNFEAGAVTRVSCIASGALVAVLVLLFAPAADVIPIAALAGTLVHVGFKLVDVARLRGLFSTTTGDRVVLLVSFGGVLFAEHLENALFMGIGVSIVAALMRAEGFRLRVLEETQDGLLREIPSDRGGRLPEVTLLNLQGELFFAAAEELQAELVRKLDAGARVLVLRVQEAYNMDATTAAAIAHVADTARARGGRLILCGVRAGTRGVLERSGMLQRIGHDAVFPAEREFLASTRNALAYARNLAAGEATKPAVTASGA
jgi:SulP family sulfate permease